MLRLTWMTFQMYKSVRENLSKNCTQHVVSKQQDIWMCAFREVVSGYTGGLQQHEWGQAGFAPVEDCLRLLGFAWV